MLADVLLSLAALCLMAGFVLLVSTLRLPPEQRRHRVGSVWAALLLAVLSGALFVTYAGVAQGAALAYRTQVYTQFSQLPRIDRLTQSRLHVDYNNADTVPLNGTIWLTVVVSPTKAFFATVPRHGHDPLWLKMHLSTLGFNVTPVLDETQRLPHDVVTFSWILQGNQSGNQVVNVRGVAFRTGPQGRIYDRATVVDAMRSIDVKAPLSLDAWAPIMVALIGLLGTGTLPLIIQSLRERAATPASAPSPAAPTPASSPAQA